MVAFGYATRCDCCDKSGRLLGWLTHGAEAKGNGYAFKHGRYTVDHIEERCHSADLLRDMKGFLDELAGTE